MPWLERWLPSSTVAWERRQNHHRHYQQQQLQQHLQIHHRQVQNRQTAAKVNCWLAPASGATSRLQLSTTSTADRVHRFRWVIYWRHWKLSIKSEEAPTSTWLSLPVQLNLSNFFLFSSPSPFLLQVVIGGSIYDIVTKAHSDSVQVRVSFSDCHLPFCGCAIAICLIACISVLSFLHLCSLTLPCH